MYKTRYICIRNIIKRWKLVDINNTTSTRSVIFSYFSKMTDIYGEVEKWKQDYLYILQSSITVPTGDLMDGLEVKLYGGNTVSRHEKKPL